MSYEKIQQCPINDDCGAKNLFLDNETQEVMRYNYHEATFVKHSCTGRSRESLKPTKAYLGEWYHKKSDRTRYIGPVRLRRSAEIMPIDGTKYKNRGGDEANWILIDVHVTDLNWTPVDDGSSGQETGS